MQFPKADSRSSTLCTTTESGREFRMCSSSAERGRSRVREGHRREKISDEGKPLPQIPGTLMPVSHNILTFSNNKVSIKRAWQPMKGHKLYGKLSSMNMTSSNCEVKPFNSIAFPDKIQSYPDLLLSLVEAGRSCCLHNSNKFRSWLSSLQLIFNKQLCWR